MKRHELRVKLEKPMKFRTVCFLAGLMLSALGAASDPQVDTLLSQMRKAYASVGSARLTVKAILVDKGGKELTTEVRFKRPKRVRETIEGLLSGGKTVTVTSDGKQVVSNGGVPFASEDEDALQEVNTPEINLETVALWDWERQLSTSENGNMHGARSSWFRTRPGTGSTGSCWKSGLGATSPSCGTSSTPKRS